MEFISEEELKSIKDEELIATAPQEDVDIEIEQDLDDWIEEEETIAIKSLFNYDLLSSVELLLTHDMELFNFDLKQLVSEHCGGDDISVIRLINFIRSSAASQSIDNNDQFISDLILKIEQKAFLQGEDYMKPIIEDDPLLYLYEGTLIAEEAD